MHTVCFSDGSTMLECDIENNCCIFFRLERHNYNYRRNEEIWCHTCFPWSPGMMEMNVERDPKTFGWLAHKREEEAPIMKKYQLLLAARYGGTLMTKCYHVALWMKPTYEINYWDGAQLQIALKSYRLRFSNLEAHIKDQNVLCKDVIVHMQFTFLSIRAVLSPHFGKIQQLTQLIILYACFPHLLEFATNLIQMDVNGSLQDYKSFLQEIIDLLHQNKYW